MQKFAREWRSFAVLTVALTIGCAGSAEETRQLDEMDYRIIENYYGPEIRFNDWRITQGELATDHVFRQTRGVWQDDGQGVDGFFSAGGYIQIYATDPATVTRQDYIYGGGGDVELRFRFEVEHLEENGSVTFRLNDARRGSDGEQGFRLEVSSDEAVFYYRNQQIGQSAIETGRSTFHDLVFATLAEEYAFQLNGETVAAGNMERYSQDNEGWIHIDVAGGGVRLLEFQENFIAHNREFNDWQKAELLYEETFGQESWDENWVLNGESPIISEDSFIFRPMSNVILEQRFEGPVAIEIEATPMPSDDHSAGLTDAIFIWMMNHPDQNLPEFMQNLPDANRYHYDEVAFYWMDFGGTNNVTTRQRRSPNLRMVRQFTDPARLLKRDTTYDITLVQNESVFEFWVDGEPWIQAHDPEPLTSGHIGHRSFNSELKVTGLKVWRIEK